MGICSSLIFLSLRLAVLPAQLLSVREPPPPRSLLPMLPSPGAGLAHMMTMTVQGHLNPEPLHSLMDSCLGTYHSSTREQSSLPKGPQVLV